MTFSSRLRLSSLLAIAALVAAGCSSGSTTTTTPALASASPAPSATPTQGAIGGGSTPSPAPSFTAPTLTFVNAAAGGAPIVPSSQINLYFIGQSGATWYTVNGSGQLSPTSTSPAPAITMPPNQNTLVLPLPQLVNARFYVAVVPTGSTGISPTLSISAPSSGAQPTWPAPWKPTDPNTNALMDWVEYSYNGSGSNYTFNTTGVDMMGLPLTIAPLPASAIAPPSIGTQVGLASGQRSALISAMRALGAPWSSLVQSSGTTDLRIIAPGHGIENGIFTANYLDSSINNVYSYYSTNTMVMQTNLGGGSFPSSMTGTVSGNTLTFSAPGYNNITFAKPTTVSTLECAAPPPNPGENAGLQARMFAQMCAGYNRGTLIPVPTPSPSTAATTYPQPNFSPAAFYVNAPVNQYAKLMHQYAINGWAYGFAYDDQGTFSSTITDTATTNVTITLNPFAGTPG